jgi:DNA-binding transcriptional LysR family regulator
LALNHQHLRAFHSVATDGSFSRAARRLNISQPTLSQQIKALEQRHGTPLFEGRRRPLLLTPMGNELLALTQRMFATAEEIDNLLGKHPAGDRLTLRLTADSPIYAARLVQAMLQTEPLLDVIVQIENSEQTLNRLLDARADVAIISDPQIDPRFAYKPLFVDYLKVLVPAGHRLAGEAVYPLACLAEDCLLIREPSSKTRGAGDSLLRAHDLHPPRTIELHSREAIREAVALGMGISLFFSAECPFDSRMAVLEPEFQPDASLLTGYVVCCADQRRSLLMRRVLQAAETLEPLSPIPLELLGSKP